MTFFHITNVGLNIDQEGRTKDARIFYNMLKGHTSPVKNDIYQLSHKSLKSTKHISSYY